MTEKMEKPERPHIRWGAFAISVTAAPVLTVGAILGPLWFADLILDSHNTGTWLRALAPLSMLGVATYAVIAPPVLIFHLRRHAPDIGRIVALSVLCVSALFALAVVACVLTFDIRWVLFGGLAAIYALIGAPILAAVFARLYIHLAQR